VNRKCPHRNTILQLLISLHILYPLKLQTPQTDNTYRTDFVTCFWSVVRLHHVIILSIVNDDDDDDDDNDDAHLESTFSKLTMAIPDNGILLDRASYSKDVWTSERWVIGYLTISATAGLLVVHYSEFLVVSQLIFPQVLASGMIWICGTGLGFECEILGLAVEINTDLFTSLPKRQSETRIVCISLSYNRLSYCIDLRGAP